MKKFRLALLAATAATSIAGSAAIADTNKAYVSQDGSGNTVAIVQNSGATTGNDIGDVSDPVLQDGDGNSLDITQSGDNNDIGIVGPGVDQLGDGNVITAVQSSDGNAIGSVQQDSNFTTTTATGVNALDVTQQLGSGSSTGNGNEVSVVRQTTDSDGSNSATVLQEGNGNEIALIDQTNTGSSANTIDVTLTGTGNGNVGFSTSYAAAAGVGSSQLIQNGTNNSIDLTATGNFNQFGINQQGDANTLSVLTMTGNTNELGISQDSSSGGSNDLTITGINGDSNDIGVIQNGIGVNTGTIALGATSGTSSSNKVMLTQQEGATASITVFSGDSNDIDVNQSGGTASLNGATIEVTGSSNSMDVIQSNGGGNTFNATIFGDSNGVGTYTASGAADNVGLTSGEFIQAGAGNTATFNVGLTTSSLSSNNILAMSQVGDSNSVSVDISGGDNNEVAIAQTGNSNTSVVTQVGSNNVVGISQ